MLTCLQCSLSSQHSLSLNQSHSLTHYPPTTDTDTHLPPVIFPINPGGVDTDLAHDSLARDPTMKGLQTGHSMITVEESARAMITVDESARGVLEQIDVATRETHGGNFVDYTGLGKWAW